MKRSLLARLEALEGGSDTDMAGYYRWLQERDAWWYRHERKRLLEMQAKGEPIPPNEAWYLRFPEPRAQVSEDGPFPDFGSKEYPATKAQLRAHRQSKAKLSDNTSLLAALRAIEVLPQASAEATGAAIETPKPETSPEVHEPQGVNPGIPEQAERPLPMKVYHDGELQTAKVIKFPQEPTPQARDDWYKPGRDDRDDPSFQPNYPD